jgi:hypothetical protein
MRKKTYLQDAVLPILRVQSSQGHFLEIYSLSFNDILV